LSKKTAFVREIVKEVSGYVARRGELDQQRANDDGIDLHHTSVVLSNSSETARTSVRVSWQRRGYVSEHKLQGSSQLIYE
jgi:hypothetical protein